MLERQQMTPEEKRRRYLAAIIETAERINRPSGAKETSLSRP